MKKLNVLATNPDVWTQQKRQDYTQSILESVDFEDGLILEQALKGKLDCKLTKKHLEDVYGEDFFK